MFGDGFIPAHAGKTRHRRISGYRHWAHPRSRGENTHGDSIDGTSVGSSPLTRGKLGFIKIVKRTLGLIPAHAGKTESSARAGPSTRAHPRSRGENVSKARCRVQARDSSPLTRGKRFLFEHLVVEHRLIPAHAGKTGDRRRGDQGQRAHPRSRGENNGGIWGAVKGGGSSPLTRGKLAVVLGSTHRRGLIPAHAGKTQSTRLYLLPLAAHPRSRGENRQRTRPFSSVFGSSPLTRGKLATLADRRRPGRLIPAHAGKTASPPSPAP